ncbi:DUF58 domain-containing protein [Marisediminicola sp. LYQ134]|uniref:DUF58 domain-containing protein n=1 Tax=unclassified Marisediminicola TaxID=2618316 RepID=UPI00398340C1
MTAPHEVAVERAQRAGLSIVAPLRALAAATGPRLAALARVVGRAVGPVLGVVTPAGWTVLAFAVVAVTLSLVFAWQEFTYLGSVLLAAFVLATVFLIGRSSYGVEIELNPRRVVVGDRALGRMVVTNTGARPLSPVRMELPVGKGLAEFQLPAMAPGEEHEELFAVPTTKRAVIVAGPAESVRGDQLGLMRRAVRWTEPVELFVHPATVRLAATASGLVRDLEGQVSKKITNSDIAFHALRPYVPGDDRRYVHWRTSARIGQLMVRQFEETRRSQLTIIHNSLESLYASEEEFELAVSVTASIGAQVLRDGTQMNIVSESGVWRTPSVTSMLDHSSRIEPAGRIFESTRSFAREQTKRLPAPSIVMIVGGSLMSTAEFRSIESLFGQDTTQIGFRISAGAAPSISAVGSLTLVTVGRLSDLGMLVRVAS